MPVSKEGPSVEWLKEIIDTYVDSQTYPTLRKALEFILDYQINIEGIVEYNVTRSLYIIDRTHKEFIQFKGTYAEDFDKKASNVWQELCNRLYPITQSLGSWINDFALVPSHSFYSRVHKFHIKVMTDTKGVEEFRRFYRKNMGTIWNEEIAAVTRTQHAFSDWIERTKTLQNVINAETFKIL
jgi:hypothetical protein